jgi:hypothetical protein
MIEFKVPVFGPPPGLPINISHYQCTLAIRGSSQTETYLVESPNP